MDNLGQALQQSDILAFPQEEQDDDLDVRCPSCNAVMLDHALPTGALVFRCRACGLILI